MDTKGDPSSEGLVALRGGRAIGPADIKLHLAAAVRLQHVGVLLGAGASMGPLGGRSMKGTWDCFKASNKYLPWLRDQSFVAGNGEPNCERLLGELEVALAEWGRAHDDRVPEAVRVRHGLLRHVVGGAILKSEWWADPHRVTIGSTELEFHRKLLQRLTGARQPGQASPWVFTTNYDLAVEWAAESLGLKVTNGFDGLHRRVFMAHNFDIGYRNVLARGEARFGTYNVCLAKLHGSLTWRETADGFVEERPAASCWPDLQQCRSGGGVCRPPFLIYPHAAKYVEAVGFVYGELVRRFVEFLSRPQTCLITCGYSFHDQHLNRILMSALHNPTLQLVIYLPEAGIAGGAESANRTIEAEKIGKWKCSDWVKDVVRARLPSVTVVGGGKRAHFDQLVRDLPDPLIFDEHSGAVRKMVREYE